MGNSGQLFRLDVERVSLAIGREAAAERRRTVIWGGREREEEEGKVMEKSADSSKESLVATGRS